MSLVVNYVSGQMERLLVSIIVTCFNFFFSDNSKVNQLNTNVYGAYELLISMFHVRVCQYIFGCPSCQMSKFEDLNVGRILGNVLCRALNKIF